MDHHTLHSINKQLNASLGTEGKESNCNFYIKKRKEGRKDRNCNFT